MPSPLEGHSRNSSSSFQEKLVFFEFFKEEQTDFEVLRLSKGRTDSQKLAVGLSSLHPDQEIDREPAVADLGFELFFLKAAEDHYKLVLHHTGTDHHVAVPEPGDDVLAVELELHQIKALLDSVDQAIALHPLVPQLQVEEGLQQLPLRKRRGEDEVYLYLLLPGHEEPSLREVALELEALVAIQKAGFFRADRHRKGELFLLELGLFVFERRDIKHCSSEELFLILLVPIPLLDKILLLLLLVKALLGSLGTHALLPFLAAFFEGEMIPFLPLMYFVIFLPALLQFGRGRPPQPDPVSQVMNLVVDLLRVLLATACDQVLLVAGNDEAEAVVLVDLHGLVGKPAAGEIEALLYFLRFLRPQFGQQLLLGTLRQDHCVALPAGEKARLLLKADLENRMLFPHTWRDLLVRGEIRLHFLYFALHGFIDFI